MSKQQEGVWDDVSCQECGADIKTDLCEVNVRLVFEVSHFVEYKPKSIDGPKEMWVSRSANRPRCYHAWRGRRWRSCLHGGHGSVCLTTDISFASYNIDDDNVRCWFCDAVVHLKDLRYHFDNNDLCGLRKTTLLGTVISYLNHVTNEDPKNVHCGTEAQTEWLTDPDSDWDNWKQDFGMSVVLGKFPFKKTVEFNDEEEMREKARDKYGKSLLKLVKTRKELNPTKLIKQQ
jgi:hypothetical protein